MDCQVGDGEVETVNKVQQGVPWRSQIHGFSYQQIQGYMRRQRRWLVGSQDGTFWEVSNWGTCDLRQFRGKGVGGRSDGILELEWLKDKR